MWADDRPPWETGGGFSVGWLASTPFGDHVKAIKDRAVDEGVLTQEEADTIFDKDRSINEVIADLRRWQAVDRRELADTIAAQFGARQARAADALALVSRPTGAPGVVGAAVPASSSSAWLWGLGALGVAGLAIWWRRRRRAAR